MSNYSIIPLPISMLKSEKGTMTYLTNHGQQIIRPYVFWYIRSDNKNILIDSAIEAEDYRAYHPAFSNFPFKKIQTFEQALAKVSCSPEEIDIVIQTHLHMDHTYNTPKCKNAKIYVQKAELDFALKPHPIFKLFFPKKIIETLNFVIIEGNSQILPGINVILAPGHTPGTQAVSIKTNKGLAIITGACSIADNYFPPRDVKTKISPFATYPVISPGIHTNLFDSYESALKIKKLAQIIIPMHEPDLAFKDHIP